MLRFLTILALFLAVYTANPGQSEARELPKAKLLAVYFYADWCPNCKILSPEITAARKDAALDGKDILFVTLDLTDKVKIHQTILHAQALGIGDFLKAQGSATGYIAVLDAQSKQELFRFDRESKSAEIAQKLQEALHTQ